MYGVLPPELLVAVLVLLDWRSIVRSTAVCRTFYALIHTSCLLQYRIELDAASLVDTSSSSSSKGLGLVSVPIATRLAHLREYLTAWRTLSSTRIVTVPTPHLDELIAYEFVGGFFAAILHKFVPDENGKRAKALVLTTLPGSKTGDDETDVEYNRILDDDLDVDCNDFAIDPSQDLLVFTEWSKRSPSQTVTSLSAHIRTLSTNKKHPRASTATLHFNLKEDESFADSIMAMQVCEDVLAIFAYSNTVIEREQEGGATTLQTEMKLRAVVWEWTTGKRLLSRSFPHKTAQGISLISRGSLMVTSCEPIGSLQLFPLRKVSKSMNRPLIRLLLPTLSSTAQYVSLGTHTGPFTANTSNPRAWVERGDEEGTRVHVMSMTIIAGQRAPMNLLAIVSNSVLCKYARMHAEAPGPVEIPWQEWGPANSRWLEGCIKSEWLRYVHGAKFARTVDSWEPHHQLRRHIQVLDFGVHLTASDDRACDSDSDDPSHSGMKCHALSKTRNLRTYLECSSSTTRYVSSKEPNVYRDPHFFREPVETQLPYLETTTKTAYCYSGLMIDGERIVGINREWTGGSDNDSLHVHTF